MAAFLFTFASLQNASNISCQSTWHSNSPLSARSTSAYLLTSFVKPVREKSCSLCLLFTSCATHIKQYVRICSEELVNNAKHGLHYLNVIRRCNVVKVGEIKPICLKKRMFLYFKVDSISAAFIRFKIKDFTSIPYFVWREKTLIKAISSLFMT